MAKNKIEDILIIVSLLILVFALYYPILNYPFHNWDDGTYIYNNERVCKGLTLENVKWAFTTLYFGFYYPFTWLSHMIDVELYGLSPKGHYLTSIIFHSLNTILLFYFFFLYTSDKIKSFIASAIFAIHSMNIESVAWLAERKNLLSTFFLLITFIFYFYCVKSETPKKKLIFYLLSILFYSFGIMSKTSIVILPFLLILLDFYPLQRFSLKKKKERVNSIKISLLEKIPYLVVSIISGILTIIAQNKIQAILPIPLYQKIVQTILSLGFYIYKFFFPFKLSAFYEHSKGNFNFFELMLIIIFLTAITIFFIKVYKKKNELLFGFLFFLISLLPVIGLIQAGLQGKATRYVYFPYWGLLFILIFGIPWEKVFKNRKFVFIVVLLSFLYLFVLSSIQVKVWKDDKTLFQNVISIESNSFLGYLKLGNYYAQVEKNYDEALKYYLIAEEKNNKEPLILKNIGTLYLLKGDIQKAKDHFLKAIEISPTFIPAYQQMVAILQYEKDYKKAEEYLKKTQILGANLEETLETIKEVEYLIKQSQIKN